MFDYSQLYLPVQVLRDASIDYVLGIESIYEMAELETKTNDLSKNIIFLEENDGILNPGEIQKVDGVYEIRISLTFCQFMWAVGLFMSTVFDNKVQIPFMDAVGTNIHGYKPNQSAVDFAEDSFFRARELLYPGWNREMFFQIPNICDPQVFKEEISRANALMIGGVAFLFTHELAHNILGHTHIMAIPDQVVKDEIAADNFAMGYLSDTFDTDNGYTNKVGIANLLCSLLLMSSNSVSGGSSHPHMDIRIDMMMKRMELPETDILWGYVGCAMRLWLLVYGGYSIEEDMELKGFNFYHDFYDFYLKKLHEARQKLFPEFIKPEWYSE